MGGREYKPEPLSLPVDRKMTDPFPVGKDDSQEDSRKSIPPIGSGWKPCCRSVLTGSFVEDLGQDRVHWIWMAKRQIGCETF